MSTTIEGRRSIRSSISARNRAATATHEYFCSISDFARADTREARGRVVAGERRLHCVPEFVDVWLDPHRALDREVRLRRANVEPDGVRCLIRHEIGESGRRDRDHRYLGEHRLSDGQTESLAARRMDVGVGQGVQRIDPGPVEVAIDPANVGRVGVTASHLIEELGHVVVRVREGLEDQRHVVIAAEPVEVRPEQDVDTLARKRCADVQEAETLQSCQFWRLDMCSGIGRDTPTPTATVGTSTPEPRSNSQTNSDIAPIPSRCALKSSTYCWGRRLSSQPKYWNVSPPGESSTRGGYIWRITTSGNGTPGCFAYRRAAAG